MKFTISVIQSNTTKHTKKQKNIPRMKGGKIKQAWLSNDILKIAYRVIIAVIYIFKKLKKRLSMLRRDNKNMEKTEILKVKIMSNIK